MSNIISARSTRAIKLPCCASTTTLGRKGRQATYDFSRVASGFAVGYFQQPWGAASGFGLLIGIQAVIVAVATGVLTCLYVFGERLRLRGGPLKFKGSS
jgi:hypothetical protein